MLLKILCFLLFGFVCAFKSYPQAEKSAAFYYQQGKEAMLEDDWYSAAESFLDCLRVNPSHAEATRSLAESYYELGEYDEALVWVRKARSLARLNAETANLEAFILIATGQLNEADKAIKDVLSREPYNREALFAAAELDIARGRTGDAVTKYKNAVKLYGDDRRLLVSLALVLGSLGDYSAAVAYIERAEAAHPDDFRVFYFAAYLGARAGKIHQAIKDAERCISLRPGYAAARDLLASLRYQAGDYNDAVRLADESIAANRKDISAWFLKGMALWRVKRISEARSTLESALSIDTEDEFIRAAVEELVISDTPIESSERKRWAAYHFQRGADYKRRNLSGEALFEYRRGLRINPYAEERRDYAEILKINGYPSLYLDELKFMVDLGKGSRAINDTIETYTNLLSTSLSKQWPVKPEEFVPHWNIAVFSVAGQSAFYHTDAGFIAATYLKDIMNHSRKVNVMDFEIREPSFAAAFRTAREANNGGVKCDYFMLVSISENERALSLKAELFTARTGAKAAEFTIYRTGQNRLRGAAINISGRVEDVLPFRAVILRRNADRSLIDKGKIDGVSSGASFDIIKKGKLELQSGGIGFKYLPQDIAGTFAVTVVDEEISAGNLMRQGHFDIISIGDEIIARNQKENEPVKTPVLNVDPELRSLLMTLRQ
ncbi:MAG: tetratricopeptide repeat protein [Spirochaetaceae bacterium]|nr:tetratricopeptide repeat protein [Spirochaetaceae bacterium]